MRRSALTPIFNRKIRYGHVQVGHQIGVIPPPDPVTVTINQAVGQADPTIIPSVDFDVVFSEPPGSSSDADESVDLEGYGP